MISMLNVARLLSVLGGMAMACVSTAAPLAANDPASAQAESAPPPEGASVLPDTSPGADPASTTLASDEQAAPAHDSATHQEKSESSPSHSEHAAHDSGAQAGHDHAAHGHAAHDHGTQSSPEQAAPKEQAVIYTCPMHPEIQDKKPGRCPKCGMNLEPVKPDAK